MSDDTHTPVNEDGVGSIIQFEMPNAIITLKQYLPVEGQDAAIEIEVWPREGLSAYVALMPAVAAQVGARLIELASELAILSPEPMEGAKIIPPGRMN